MTKSKRAMRVKRGFVLALLATAFVVGYLTHRNQWIPASVRHSMRARVEAVSNFLNRPPADTGGPPGAWNPAPYGAAGGNLDEEAMARLAAIGYAGGYEDAPRRNGVIVHAAGAYDGLNLYNSGHGPEAHLVDMDGTVVHSWACDFATAWPSVTPADEANSHEYWRRVHLYPNGDLLAIFDGEGLVKIDPSSRILWAARAGYHHDLFVDDNGLIYTLDREERIIPRISERENVIEDFVAVLDPDGRVLRRVSLLECFEGSAYASVLNKMPYYGDIFHTNTIELLDGRLAHRSAAFRQGNVLVSLFTLNTIAAVDLEAGRVEWALSGMWVKQHQPTVLDSGDILLFDNQGNGGRSKVVEFDPFTQKVSWQYADSQSTPFFSALCGSCQRLPNGNTLITESTRGRAFEVTPEGATVWEFLNPHRAGEQGELIATLFEVIRLAPNAGAAWLPAASSP
ncbi:MAG: hypothetical protein GY851_21350 [bacterium]|nr:hypothetical protein [bacterium]